MGKVCNNCGENKKRSEEWMLSSELAKSNRRLSMAVGVLSVCCVALIALMIILAVG
jgi:hypothetical protein